MDDGTIIVDSLNTLLTYEGPLAVLHAVLGLSLNVSKCKLIPIGAQDVAEFTECFEGIQRALLDGVSVVDCARWLGICIGRSRYQPHQFMIERMRSRIHTVRQLGVGSAGATQVGAAVLLSIPRHTLRLSGPNDDLEAAWNECQSAMFPGWRPFMQGSLPRLRELFGVSCSLPLLAQVALESQLSHIARLRFDPRVMMNELRDEAGPLLEVHPLQEWRARGCLATWCRVLDVAEQLGVLRLRRIGSELEFVQTASWISIKKAIGDKYVASIAVLRDRFHSSFRKALAAERVPPAFLSESFIRVVCVCDLPAPSMTVALLRVLFGGFRIPAHGNHLHHGNCCLCAQWHTGTPQSVVVRGCFRVSFSSIKALRFLAETPPLVLLEMISRCGHKVAPDGTDLRRLGSVVLLIAELSLLRHSCLHKSLDTVTPIAAWRALKRRRH
eukprot:2098961-Amphidinium_carterae.2